MSGISDVRVEIIGSLHQGTKTIKTFFLS